MEQERRTDTRRRSRKKPKKKRSPLFDVISGIVLIAAVCVFVFSLYQLVMMLVPYYTGGKEYDEIQDLAVEADADGTGFSVDFDELLAINPDTVAWIRFDEPSIINYPVVKSADNEEYLTKTFAENDNKLGAIFMDYIYTPDGKIRTYTVFAAGEVSAVSENYQVEFASDEEYEQFLGKCSVDSAYPVDVELNAGSQIITLSTCTGDGHANRFVVRGVLTAVD